MQAALATVKGIHVSGGIVDSDAEKRRLYLAKRYIPLDSFVLNIMPNKTNIAENFIRPGILSEYYRQLYPV